MPSQSTDNAKKKKILHILFSFPQPLISPQMYHQLHLKSPLYEPDVFKGKGLYMFAT